MCLMTEDSLIKSLKKCGAIQFGNFVLTSGAESDYYIDIKKASTNPKTLKMIAKHMVKFVSGSDIIAGMELGAVPLIVALSLETNIPYVIIRKTKRSHGTGKQIEGGNVEDKNVLIIEDVTTSGGSVVKTIDIIKENNGTIVNVVTVVDRECGAKEVITDQKVLFTPLLTVSEILDD